MINNTANKLINFIDESPSVFHVVANIKKNLLENGFMELKEQEKWKIEPHKNYFVIRNNSSLLAFKTVAQDFAGFHIVASHSDSPSFKIKENPEIPTGESYVSLNTERYGGMIMSTWMDRPLSVAGRVIIKEGNQYTEKLVDVNRDLMIIPSVAIHMDRTANDGKKYNAQVDTIPLFGGSGTKGEFEKLIAQTASAEKEDILASDLFLYNRQKGTTLGMNNEFVSSPKLDDLQCVYCSMEGFIQAQPTQSVPVLAVFDNEEVGSGTKQGAASTFLFDTLTRLNRTLGNDTEAYHTALANSFMISADNAHALHPNHNALADPTNKPVLNGGVVIKHSANQKYTSDAVSVAIFKGIVKELGLDFQNFLNRSDSMGGSTLGNISTTNVALNCVDIGLPQLAMHSSYETAGVKDTEDFIHICKSFYTKSILAQDGGYTIR